MLCSKIVSEPKINGMDANGLESTDTTPLKRLFGTPPAPANSPVTTNSWFSGGTSADTSFGTVWPQGGADSATDVVTSMPVMSSSHAVSPLARESIHPAVPPPTVTSTHDTTSTQADVVTCSKSDGFGNQDESKSADVETVNKAPEKEATKPQEWVAADDKVNSTGKKTSTEEDQQPEKQEGSAVTMANSDVPIASSGDQGTNVWFLIPSLVSVTTCNYIATNLSK